MGRKNKVRKLVDYKTANTKLNLDMPDANDEPVTEKVQIKKVVGRTPGQKEVIKSILSNDLTFVSGVAGTGKTLISVGIALELLSKERIEKIIISRPLVEAGEKMGFLPGGIDEKTQPFLIPIYDSFLKFITKPQLDDWKKNNIIEIAPVGMLRGRTFEKAVVIMDEAQNATLDQLKMIVTRLGEDSKLVINGDPTQSDLPYHSRGAFQLFCEILKDENDIAVIYLTDSDIQRHRLIKQILPKIGFLSEKDLQQLNVGLKTDLEFKRPPRELGEVFRGWMDREEVD